MVNRGQPLLVSILSRYDVPMGWLWRHVLLPTLVGVLVSVLAHPLAFAEQRRRVRTGFIEVVSMTAGAEVYVDGEQVGEVPLPEKLRVSVGEYSVKVSKRGHTQHMEVVRVKNRRTATVEADLLALSGILLLEADVEGARVFIDDDYIGDAPIDYDVEPGERVLRVSVPGYYDFERTIEVIAGEETVIQAELERLPPEEDPTIVEPPRERRWYEHWWVWTIVGTVVVAAAVAIPVGITQRGDICSKVAGWGSCEDADFTLDYDN